MAIDPKLVEIKRQRTCEITTCIRKLKDFFFFEKREGTTQHGVPIIRKLKDRIDISILHKSPIDKTLANHLTLDILP